jgi:hypothetical protein
MAAFPKLPLPWAAALVFAAATFIAAEGGYRLWKQANEPKAKLSFDGANVRYVQEGTLQGPHRHSPINQVIYKVGVVNLCRRSLAGLRVMFVNGEPYEKHVMYPGSPLSVFEQRHIVDGTFALNAVDQADPSIFVNFLEVQEQSGGNARIRLMYAAHDLPKWFDLPCDTVITLRLEGLDLNEAVAMKLLIRFNDKANKYEIQVVN